MKRYKISTDIHGKYLRPSVSVNLRSSVQLKQAVDFHGHLGPYLVMGILAGRLALKKLNCRKYFGLKVKVWGADKKPKSCLVDGLQISTGATYGKGNIQKLNGAKLRILFHNLENKKKLLLNLRQDLAEQLNNLKSHRDSEVFAEKLFNIDPLKLFTLTP